MWLTLSVQMHFIDMSGKSEVHINIVNGERTIRGLSHKHKYSHEIFADGDNIPAHNKMIVDTICYMQGMSYKLTYFSRRRLTLGKE